MEEKVTDLIACRDFQAAAVAAGIKKQPVLDLGLIYTSTPASVAGVFTRNLVQAAPVVLSKQRLATGKARAIVVNAGNAKCCTGAQGMHDALSITADVAAQLGLSPEEVLVASTGVIGVPLPLQAMQQAIPPLAASLCPDGFDDLARAIMTTDTVPKITQRKGRLQGKEYKLIGVAKGAGMIRPDMATLLSFICTDVAMPAESLQVVLAQAVERTFNRLTIDGDTSTNDTVLALANGASGVSVQTAAEISEFQALLDDLMLELARRFLPWQSRSGGYARVAGAVHMDLGFHRADARLVGNKHGVHVLGRARCLDGNRMQQRADFRVRDEAVEVKLQVLGVHDVIAPAVLAPVDAVAVGDHGIE